MTAGGRALNAQPPKLFGLRNHRPKGFSMHTYAANPFLNDSTVQARPAARPIEAARLQYLGE